MYINAAFLLKKFLESDLPLNSIIVLCCVVEVAAEDPEGCGCFVWRREWIQSGHRVVCRGALQCQVHPGKETHWFVTASK